MNEDYGKVVIGVIQHGEPEKPKTLWLLWHKLPHEQCITHSDAPHVLGEHSELFSTTLCTSAFVIAHHHRVIPLNPLFA